MDNVRIKQNMQHLYTGICQARVYTDCEIKEERRAERKETLWKNIQL